MSKIATVTAYAEELLQRVHFIDMHGHKIGFDFQRVHEMIKKRFPASKMSLAGLRRVIKYEMTVKQMPMPSHPKVRKGSRCKAAHDFTRALLMQRDVNGVGLSFDVIRNRVSKNFPGEPKLSLSHAERMLVYRHPNRMPHARATKP